MIRDAFRSGLQSTGRAITAARVSDDEWLNRSQRQIDVGDEPLKIAGEAHHAGRSSGTI